MSGFCSECYFIAFQNHHRNFVQNLKVLSQSLFFLMKNLKQWQLLDYVISEKTCLLELGCCFMRTNRIVESRGMSWDLCEEHFLNINVNSPATPLMLSGKGEEEVLGMELIQTVWLCNHLLSGPNRPAHQAR